MGKNCKHTNKKECEKKYKKTHENYNNKKQVLIICSNITGPNYSFTRHYYCAYLLMPTYSPLLFRVYRPSK